MKILEKEIWKDLPNYEGYQVSNLGRVKSLKRSRKGKNGSLVSVKEKILKPQLIRGYYRVALCKNSIRKMYFVHRLVWLAFNSPIPEGLQVNHINEIKTDNRLSNLNLMTCKENVNYGTGIDRCHNQLINGKCSKPVLQFTLDGILIKEYPSIKQVEREKGFDHSYIVKCCKGKLKTAYNYIWKYKENKKGEN